MTAFVLRDGVSEIIVRRDEETGEFEQPIPEEIQAFIDNVGYCRLDGWRGYETVNAPAGWKRFLSGWHSSMERTRMSEFINKFRLPNHPVVLAFLDGSNVCSQVIDIFVPSDVNTSEIDTPVLDSYNYGFDRE